MFITTKYSGYNRHNEQSAAGLFLILMQPQLESQKYPYLISKCVRCGKAREEHPSLPPGCSTHGAVARLRRLAEAGKEAPTDERDAIWQDKFDPACAECQTRERTVRELGCTEFAPVTTNHPIRAIVRYVRMRQCGQWMMGSARVGKTRLSLSGSYGSDGLPCSVPDEAYEMGVILPDELYAAWNKGGGWNGAGSEAPAMRDWAMKNLITERKS